MTVFERTAGSEVNRPFARSVSSPRSSAERTAAGVPTGRRVAIAGGYTAGHVNTGLAIAREYESRFGATCIFIGAPGGFEERLVPPMGHQLETISGAPVMNRGPIGKLSGAWRTCIGVAQARRLLEAHRIELVVGVGSYASAATLLAARMSGISTALHEANEHPGIANRFAARFSDRIYLGSPAAHTGLGRRVQSSARATAATRQRIVVTGNPVRQEIRAFSCQPPTKDQKDPVRILVMGGSLGSAFLNERCPDLLRQLAAHRLELDVVHQAGDTDLEAIRARYRSLGVRAEVASYFDDMAKQYRSAHFAITSAGAITLAELSACGLPSLVIPLGVASNDHQLHNALAYSHHCGALFSQESGWNPSALAASIAPALKEPAVWATCSQRARRSSRCEAAKKLVEDCEAMMTTPR